MEEPIIFYKKGKDNKIISIGQASDTLNAVAHTPEEIERIYKEYPESKGKLYQLYSGVVFKID